MRLRSNTFVTLLLRSGRPELGSHPEWNKNNGGVTYSGLLADLIRLSLPGYSPKRMDTLVSYFSGYIQGNPKNSPRYLPFNTAACRNGLADRMKKEHEIVLSEMDALCRKYLDLSDFKNRLLVGGIVDAILSDETFHGRFDIGKSWVGKDELGDQSDFALQSFLLSVWNVILSDYPDTKEGAETYESWTSDAGYNTPRKITTDIGVERAKKIAVSIDLPEEDQTDTADEEHDEAIEGIVKMMEPEREEEEIKQQTLVSHNGRIYNQNAEKIVNIEHVETLYI